MTTFNVYRRDTSEDTPVAIATGVEVTNYVDTTAAEGRTYLYSIGALKDGYEKISHEILVSTVNHPVLSLFKNSEKGLWLDFTDMSSMYQDVAGLNPVTAVTQQIQRVLDKSGNNHHAAKNSGSAPTFTASGAFFNGLQQMLQTINQLDLGLSTDAEVFLSIKSLAGSSYGFILETGTTANEKAGGFNILSPEEGSAITCGVTTSTSQSVTHAYGSGLFDGVFSIRVTPATFVLDIPSVTTLTKPKSSVPIATNYLNIGARVTNQPLRFIGYIKHIVIVNRSLTALERSNLYAFLSS